jgi:site-specific recombinase XerC
VLPISATHLAPRIAGVPVETDELIRRYLEAVPFDLGEGEPLFVNNRGRRLTTRSVQISFRRRGAELGLPMTAAPICLRHAVGQRLADAGQPPAAVARALGVSVAAAGRDFGSRTPPGKARQAGFGPVRSP